MDKISIKYGNISNDKESPFNYFDYILKYIDDYSRLNPGYDVREIKKKLNEAINYYIIYYKNNMNYHIPDFSVAKVELMNLLNDCYIVSFLQIMFHTPNFLRILKSWNLQKETIIDYLIKVSEYPFNIKYFYKLKQLFSVINPDYSKPWPNDSQEFGIDLLNYLISQKKGIIQENDDISDFYSEKDFIKMKKLVLQNYISNYQKNKNELENLFLFNQIDIYYNKGSKNPNISSNLHLELTLPKYTNGISLQNLVDQKYCNDVTNNDKNIEYKRIIIKSKLIDLPQILIISINRALNNEYLNNSPVFFGENLDLKNCIDYDLFNDNNKKTSYNLYAINVCVHYKRYSHYTCYIKMENRWFLFDDNKKVKEVYATPEDYSSVIGLFYKRDI